MSSNHPRSEPCRPVIVITHRAEDLDAPHSTSCIGGVRPWHPRREELAIAGRGRLRNRVCRTLRPILAIGLYFNIMVILCLIFVAIARSASHSRDVGYLICLTGRRVRELGPEILNEIFVVL
ncbi:unnamed protein product [Heligmosomoides polygyrus]|uniref:G_PROTEIN_RECEP_F1_2 domain-containing protein n=1 Tax=Heligmosomoides polygyrus TaxID=6339 RepID=A0A183FFM7_HELPZ|nr:unnamed protein product [Heligmosomoides polygyrus]